MVFVGCYFGAGTAGGGHCIWIAHQTPTQMTFIGCGAECKNTQANGSAILIDGNTNNLAFINQSASGFTVVDYGIHFNSGAHKALKIHGMDFTGITDDHVQVESAASFEDSVMLGMRRDNAVKGWTGDFTGIMRQGFAQNRTDFGGAIIEHSFAAFTDEDATPPVSAGNNFVTANTAATSITNFDLGIAGQEITIIFGDADTTIVHDVAKIKLSGAANWNPAAGDTLTLKAYNSIWHEISRSDNT